MLIKLFHINTIKILQKFYIQLQLKFKLQSFHNKLNVTITIKILQIFYIQLQLKLQLQFYNFTYN